MPLVNRYAGVINGGVTVTGNTLVVFIQNSCPPAALPFWTGAFTSTDTANQVEGYPVGTTRDGSRASSSAVLNIPSGSEVIFAQLSWLRSAPVDANSAITFTTPGRTANVSPTRSDDTVFNFRWRAADVTDIVKADGGGTYTVGNIPVNESPSGSNAISSHWTLIVVYANSKMPYKYININTGCANVTGTSQLDYTFSGFSTPLSGPLKAYFILTATNGDPGDGAQIRVGDASANIQIGNSSNPWDGVAPYSRINNMMPANIINADPEDPNIGMVDTRGTFGTYNYNAYTDVVPAYSRVLYDIIGLDISAGLTHGQTQLKTNVTFGGAPGVGAGVCTQAVQVTLNSSSFGADLFKTVDKGTANIGDKLTYTIIFKNSGLADAANVILTDTTPYGTTFLSNTLVIDGVPDGRTNIGPGSSISFGTVYPNQSHTITYKVAVTTIPSTLKITNVGSLSYAFSLGAGLATITDTINTNVASTTINYINGPIANTASYAFTYTVNPSIPNGVSVSGDTSYALLEVNTATLACSKTVDKSFENLNTILTYTIPISNLGNAPATNVIFQDTIVSGLSLVQGSLTINGVVTAGDINPPGINLGTIVAGQLVTIAYKVNVISIPSINPIPNGATIRWNYTMNPSIPNGAILYGNTNIATTLISDPNISINKNVDKNFASVGDVLNYTLSLINAGNTIANNVILKDTIPGGTIFMQDSLTINGVVQTNTTPNYGLNLASLPIGATTVSFKVSVSTVPSTNPIPNSTNLVYTFTTNPSIPNEKSRSLNSNIVNTLVNTPSIVSTKSCNIRYATINDVVTYTIVLKNIGSAIANNVIARDTLPNGTTFITNSLTLNGITIGGTPSNINIGSIAINGLSTLTFKVLVN